MSENLGVVHHQRFLFFRRKFVPEDCGLFKLLTRPGRQHALVVACGGGEDWLRVSVCACWAEKVGDWKIFIDQILAEILTELVQL